ncbi:MAG: hypothetical protein KAU36_03920 [candidate division Zixibacteria bacterium]|nr:hypothetical protein [candidate division Zixibacteria bacterium]
MRALFTIALTIFALAVSGILPLQAEIVPGQMRLQPPPPDGGRGQGMERKRFQRLRLMKVLELLNLDDEIEDEFIVLYQSHHRDQRKIQGTKSGVINELRRVLKKQPQDADNIEQLITRINDLDRQREQNRLTFIEQVRPILTVEQLGRLYVFEARFEIEMLGKVAEFRGWRKGQPRPPVEDSADETPGK